MSFLGNFVSGQNYKIWNFGMFLWRLSYANVSVSHCICWIYLLPHPLLETISIRFRTLLNHSIVLFILRVNSEKIQISETQIIESNVSKNHKFCSSFSFCKFMRIHPIYNLRWVIFYDWALMSHTLWVIRPV